MYRAKNLFIYKKKKNVLGVITTLFLVVKPSSSDDERKLLFECSYIASGENGIWKNSLFLFFLIEIIKIIF